MKLYENMTVRLLATAVVVVVGIFAVPVKSVQWYSEQGDNVTAFPEFSYGMEFNESNCERVTMGEWTWEIINNDVDQIFDAERIRGYGLLVVYSNWSYLKNRLSDNADCRDY